MSAFAPSRDDIIRHIRELANENGGTPLGRGAFEKATGIFEHQWLGRYWTKWGDAVREAGYEPNTLQERFQSADVLRPVAELARSIGRMPTVAELKLARRDDPNIPSHNTISNHFSGQSGLARALRRFCEDTEGFADLLPHLPTESSSVPQEGAPAVSRSSEGWVYLIQSGAHFKVGRSDELERRVKEIRIALPEAATLVHAIKTDDPAGIEAYWHRRFASKRANGEWFSLSRDEIVAFRRRRFQ